MRLRLRAMGSPEHCRDLARSGAAVRVGGLHDDLFFESVWPSAALVDFLLEAAQGGSLDLNPWMEFSRAEVEQADSLRLRPRKVINDSMADFERMRADVDTLPWIGGNPMRRFRLPQRLFLSRIALKPGQVPGVGQWSAEYVVPRSVREGLEAARFSGVEFRPVFHTRSGAAHDDYFHLYSGQVLGRRRIDIASPEMRSPRPEERGYDAMGCLCYESRVLAGALAFNRAGEKLVGFEFPEWIVRSAVRTWFVECRLRGWAFEPVLQVDTPAYEEYRELWSSLRRVLAACCRHTVRGRPFTAAD